MPNRHENQKQSNVFAHDFIISPLKKQSKEVHLPYLKSNTSETIREIKESTKPTYQCKKKARKWGALSKNKQLNSQSSFKSNQASKTQSAPQQQCSGMHNSEQLTKDEIPGQDPILRDLQSKMLAEQEIQNIFGSTKKKRAPIILQSQLNKTKANNPMKVHNRNASGIFSPPKRIQTNPILKDNNFQILMKQETSLPQNMKMKQVGMSSRNLEKQVQKNNSELQNDSMEKTFYSNTSASSNGETMNQTRIDFKGQQKLTLQITPSNCQID